MKESNLSFKNIFKRETKLATYIIAVTTILVLGLSYALFFQVNSNSANQVVKSGDLAFTYSKDGTVLANNDTTLAITDSRCFYPMNETDADSLVSTCSYQFSIQNTGTLKAAYTMALKATEANTANPEHLKVILRESDGTTFNKMTGYPKTVKSILDNDGIILSGDLDKNSNILVYSIQIYLDEALADDSDYQSKVVSYKLEGKSIVHEDQAINTNPTGAETIAKLVEGSNSSSTEVIDKGTDASGCTNTLAYDDFGNLRYVGANPCNYVTFNDETAGWRIIGVFDGKIKLIRKESIGEYSWDSSLNTGSNNSSVNQGKGINQWGPSTYVYGEPDPYAGADLMRELNDYYWNSSSGNCYNDYGNNTDTSYVACNFNGEGTNIKGLSTVHDYIDNYTWKTGYLNNETLNQMSAQSLYSAERADSITPTCDNWPTCNDLVNKTTSWQGHVALIYPSDFNYAVGGEGRTACLAGYFDAEAEDNQCSAANYLANPANHKWGLSPISHQSYNTNVSILHNDITWTDAAIPGNVLPSFYLKSSVEISGGNGSTINPYTLIMP